LDHKLFTLVASAPGEVILADGAETTTIPLVSSVSWASEQTTMTVDSQTYTMVVLSPASSDVASPSARTFTTSGQATSGVLSTTGLIMPSANSPAPTGSRGTSAATRICWSGSWLGAFMLVTSVLALLL
jgi:hypothetical protein